MAYWVKHLSGKFQLNDHDQICWLEPCKLKEINWAPADIPIVEQLKHYFSTWNYYSENAKTYTSEELNVDMEPVYQSFINQLSNGEWGQTWN